jgi:hypothetical protein
MAMQERNACLLSDIEGDAATVVKRQTYSTRRPYVLQRQFSPLVSRTMRSTSCDVQLTAQAGRWEVQPKLSAVSFSSCEC